MRRDFLVSLCKVLIVVLSIAWTVVAIVRFDQSLADAAGFASFVGFVLFSLLDYLIDRDVLLAIYRGIKFLVLLLIIVALGMAVLSLVDLGEVAALLTTEEARHSAAARLSKVRIGFFASISAFLIASGYAFWKFKSTRFAEGRVGLIKDLLVQVNQTLTDSSLNAESKKRQSIDYCLATLLAAIELSPWQWLLRKLRLLRRSFCVCVVEIMEPDIAINKYKITSSAYPNDTPSSAKTVFEWVEKNYMPVFLDEIRFNELVDLAKGSNSKGWRTRFFNFKGRESVVSAVGWIGKKKVTLLSHDSMKCRAFDASYMSLLDSQNFTKPDRNWLKIRSFIGCPVGSPSLDPSPVLFVTKSIPHGFVDEDREVVIAVSQIIDMVLAATAS